MVEYSIWSGISAVNDLRDNSFTSMEGTFMQQDDGGLFTSVANDTIGFGSAMHNMSIHNSSESVLLGGEMDLLTFLQQGGAPDNSAAMREEQDIDAQIDRLMQLKQALHKQKQQQQGQQQQQPAVILEDVSFVEQSGSSLSLSGAPSLAMSSASGCSSSMALPMDSSLLDLGWGSSSSAAARAASQPARHSIDLGGLAQRMSALNMTGLGTASHGYAVAGDPAAAAAAAVASQAAGPRSSLCVALPFGSSSTPDLGAAVAAAAAAAAAAGGALTPSPGLLPVHQSALHLQSSLYAMPAPPPPAGHNMRGRMSLDVPLSGGGLPPWQQQASGLNSPAGAGCMDPAMLAAQAAHAAWLAGGAPGGSTAVAGRKLSLDVPLSRTPDSRCPPRKTPSSLTTASSSSAGSARSSPQLNTRGAPGQGQQQDGHKGSGGGVVPHQAPKWAGSTWHPMADVVRSGQLANKGTGVFIPGGGVKTTA